MQCSNGLQPGGAMAKTAKSNVPHDRGTLLFYGCAGDFEQNPPAGADGEMFTACFRKKGGHATSSYIQRGVRCVRAYLNR